LIAIKQLSDSAVEESEFSQDLDDIGFLLEFDQGLLHGKVVFFAPATEASFGQLVLEESLHCHRLSPLQQ